MTEPLPYFLITVKVIALEKVSFSSMQNLETVFNTLIADGKYSLLNRHHLTQPIQILLSLKQKSFSQFFSAFLKSTLNFGYFPKKDDPHSRCRSEITGSKNVIKQMSKKSVFRGPSNKQHGERAKTLLQSGWQHLYQICWSLWTEFNLEMALLVLSKILTVFVKTMSVDDKYSLLNRENLTQPIMILLSHK